MTKGTAFSFADRIKAENEIAMEHGYSPVFGMRAIGSVADFLNLQVDDFDRKDWMGYIETPNPWTPCSAEQWVEYLKSEK